MTNRMHSTTITPKDVAIGLFFVFSVLTAAWWFTYQISGWGIGLPNKGEVRTFYTDQGYDVQNVINRRTPGFRGCGEQGKRWAVTLEDGKNYTVCTGPFRRNWTLDTMPLPVPATEQVDGSTPG